MKSMILNINENAGARHLCFTGLTVCCIQAVHARAGKVPQRSGINAALLLLAFAGMCSASRAGVIENGQLAWRWDQSSGQIHPAQLTCEPNGPGLALSGECFQLILADAKVLKSSDFKLLEPAKIEPL